MKVKLTYLTFHNIFLHRIEQFRTTSINVCVCVRACVRVRARARVCVNGCMPINVVVVVVLRLKATLQIRLVYMHYFINDVCTCLSNCVTFVNYNGIILSYLILSYVLASLY